MAKSFVRRDTSGDGQRVAAIVSNLDQLMKGKTQVSAGVGPYDFTAVRTKNGRIQVNLTDRK